jgi:hypothetical protein
VDAMNRQAFNIYDLRDLQVAKSHLATTHVVLRSVVTVITRSVYRRFDDAACGSEFDEKREHSVLHAQKELVQSRPVRN